MAYDNYYLTKDLFGEPYPELMDFFKNFPDRGKLLDLGCGQGRNAIPLVQLGYEVTGIDNSKVGIVQMNRIALSEKLKLTGIVRDIYDFDEISEFNFVPLDSLFHFTKKDKKKEINLIKRIINKAGAKTIITFLIQNSWNKVKMLNETIDFKGKVKKYLKRSLITFSKTIKPDIYQKLIIKGW